MLQVTFIIVIVDVYKMKIIHFNTTCQLASLLAMKERKKERKKERNK
jgi:hypothetical protein